MNKKLMIASIAACVLHTLQRPKDKFSVEEIAVKIDEYENMGPFIKNLNWFIGTDLVKDIFVEFDKNYISAFIINDRLMLGFSNKHPDADDIIDQSPYYHNGRVCFENNKMFDKWSNSNTPLFLPTDKDEFDKMYNLIKYVMTDTYLSISDDDDDHDTFFHPTDAPYFEPVQDFMDWSNNDPDYIPAHLRDKFKSEN